MTSNTSALPTPVALLGYGGLIPFVGLAIAGFFVSDSLQPRVLFALITYGAIILSFVGALHWGFATARPGLSATLRMQLFIWSVVPALLGWSALLLIEISPVAASALLIAVFATHLRQDIRLVRQNGLTDLPGWYLPLRARLTLVAIISLLLGSVA